MTTTKSSLLNIEQSQVEDDKGTIIPVNNIPIHKSIEQEITNEKCIIGVKDHLYNYLKTAFAKATSVEIIVSFIMESGVRLLEENLRELAKKEIPIRILTGDYLKITQPSALYLIKDIFGEKVDLRFYSDKSRSFHPKAYIFNYGEEGEIFLGSSNMSLSALTKGLEWNYRLTKDENKEEFDYYKATFEELFYNKSICMNDEEMKAYSENWVANKLLNKNEKNYDKKEEKIQELFKPRGVQIEALYELKKTRLEGMDKALVVAATGLGKTFLAAFDSIKFKKILFVAHREEILIQSERSFKSIRPNATTGFLGNGKKDLDCDILFATVQTLGKKEYFNKENFKENHFDYIIIDEFHHAVASYYKNIINYFKPKFLLGLTATPDRLDNKDVFAICDYNTVYEIGLKKAINKDYLVPFRYYGIYDPTDYDQVQFKNGKYNDKELEKALMINKRAELVMNNYKKFNSKRAMGFCTSKAHAEYMAKFFNENRIPSCAVYSGINGEQALDRSEALSKFRNKEINVMFSVDMFNEGLDIPLIDLVMFLRPTQSPTIFFQQLGRGLRKATGKKYLNVLDFIGNYKKAVLVPFLLTGDTTLIRNRSNTRLLPKEEEYPEDCTVNFEWELVNIFKKQAEARIKTETLIKEEFYRIKEDLGTRPTRLEMLTYMDDDIYETMRKSSKINIFQNYFKFLIDINEIAEEEKPLIGTLAMDYINMLEKTLMDKTYKIPVLQAFHNGGNVKLRINDDDLYESFRNFYSKGSNGLELLKLKKSTDYKQWGKKEYLKLANEKPIKDLEKSEGKFFFRDGKDFCLVQELAEFVDNIDFGKHFVDVLEFRVGEYYRNRLQEKYKAGQIEIKYALRDEIVNIFAMTHGGLAGNFSHQIMICKKKPFPENRKVFVLDCKKSKSIYGLSQMGKDYYEVIKDEDFGLDYVAIIDDQIKIKPSLELFERLREEGLFGVWEAEAPFKYFKGEEEGYLILFRVYKLRESVPVELLEKGRLGRNYFFGLSEGAHVMKGESVLNDGEFKEIKERIFKNIYNK
jgi:superfamily II DNA or RNA helicase